MDEMTAAVTTKVLTALLFAPFLCGIILKYKKKLTTGRLCALILISGFILRLCYISYTDEFTRQHDLGSFRKMNSSHSGYIMYIMIKHSLPDMDPRGFWQLYHPPLHHVICAAILGVVSKLGFNYKTVGPGVLQVFTAAYMELFCVFAYLAFKRLGLRGRPLALSLAVVTFHPTLIILSGSLNNDALSALFGMAAVWLVLRWSQTESHIDILLCALCVGLGMLTKLSVVLLAPAIAAVFVVALIKKRRRWARFILQFAAFGAVSLPLGLCWPVRNYTRFGVPFNYIPKLDESSGQYIDVPPVKRLFDFSLYQLSSPFTQWEWEGGDYNEFNPLIALLKNAMFDEETFFEGSITLQSFCTALFFAGTLTAVLSFAALVIMWIKNKKTPFESKLLLTLVFAVVFGSYVSFCLGYPQVCTENMRYCVPLIFAGAAALGLLLRRGARTKSKFMKFLAKASALSMTSMCVMSVFVYIALGFTSNLNFKY